MYICALIMNVGVKTFTEYVDAVSDVLSVVEVTGVIRHAQIVKCQRTQIINPYS